MGSASIVDMPLSVLGRVLELLPPSLHLLQVHSSFHRAAIEECPTWWRHSVVKRRGDQRALTGFSHVASQFKVLQLDNTHAGALLLPYLEAASTRCSLLEELYLEVATVAQFQGAFQAIGNLVSLRCLALDVSTQSSLSSSSSSGWLPGSVVSPLSRLTRLEIAELNLWFARGEVPQEVLRSLGELTRLGFHSNPAALPLLTVGWGSSEAAQGNDREVAEASDGEAAEGSSGDGEAGSGSSSSSSAAGGPKLRALSFSGARLAPANCSLASLAQLERLVLGPNALCAELRALLPALPALTSLDIERPVSRLRLDMDPDSQAAGLAAAYHCRQLHELELKGWGLLRLEPLPHDAFPRLTRLELGDSWPFPGHPGPHNPGLWQVPESLPGACPLLGELDLSACTCVKLRDAGTLAVLRLLPCLRRLVLPLGTLERTAAHVRQYLGQGVEVVGGGEEAAAA